ncbi:MAG: hypothetical protein ACRELY_23515, partial [Polyangiaceae bacterium]
MRQVPALLPKDVQALAHTAHEHGVQLTLASATHHANDRQKGIVLRKLLLKRPLLIDGRNIWSTYG